MTIDTTLSISSQEAKTAIDNALGKVAKQLRELNHYVRFYLNLYGRPND
jgi:hypothetical protein